MKTMNAHVHPEPMDEFFAEEVLFSLHPVTDKLWMDHTCVCEVLGVTRKTLHRYRSKGMIYGKRQERTYLYRLPDVDLLAGYLMFKRITGIDTLLHPMIPER